MPNVSTIAAATGAGITISGTTSTIQKSMTAMRANRTASNARTSSDASNALVPVTWSTLALEKKEISVSPAPASVHNAQISLDALSANQITSGK